MYFTALGYVIHSNLFKKKKKTTLIESLLYTFIFVKVLFFKDKKDMSVNRSLYVIQSLGEFPK